MPETRITRLRLAIEPAGIMRQSLALCTQAVAPTISRVRYPLAISTPRRTSSLRQIQSDCQRGTTGRPSQLQDTGHLHWQSAIPSQYR